ncbi:MAG TPA: FmdE family protein [Anaerolineae bacterium]
MLEPLLQACAARHRQLCPRQVLGVRMGRLAGQLLDLTLPQPDKRLLAIVETDGCAADGIAVATGCSVGRRTMRVEDLGKVAATFVDTATGCAMRIVPRLESRALARRYAPEASNRWEAQLLGYQCMGDDLLFTWQRVELVIPLEEVIGHAGVRVICERCQEEIINGREVVDGGVVLCRSCAGQPYYRLPPMQNPSVHECQPDHSRIC